MQSTIVIHYYGFVIQEGNFQSRTVLIPINKTGGMKQDWLQNMELLKEQADAKNILLNDRKGEQHLIPYFFIEDVQWSNPKMTLPNDGSCVEKPWSKFMSDVRYLADWGPDGHGDEKPEKEKEEWEKYVICDLFSGFDHVKSCADMLLLKRWKCLPHHLQPNIANLIVDCVFLVLTRDNYPGSKPVINVLESRSGISTVSEMFSTYYPEVPIDDLKKKEKMQENHLKKQC